MLREYHLVQSAGSHRIKYLPKDVTKNDLKQAMDLFFEHLQFELNGERVLVYNHKTTSPTKGLHLNISPEPKGSIDYYFHDNPKSSRIVQGSPHVMCARITKSRGVVFEYTLRFQPDPRL